MGPGKVADFQPRIGLKSTTDPVYSKSGMNFCDFGGVIPLDGAPRLRSRGEKTPVSACFRVIGSMDLNLAREQVPNSGIMRLPRRIFNPLGAISNRPLRAYSGNSLAAISEK
jgi:hypothetical protein